MADEIKIESAVFHERLGNLINNWKGDNRAGNNAYHGAGALAIVMGKSEEDQGLNKTSALQSWLLGYEFPSTLFIITTEAMYIVTTKKKAAYLEPLKGGKTPVEVLVRGKDAAENEKQFKRCLDLIKTAGNKVGVLTKDQTTGPFVTEWKNAYSEVSKEVEEVDISAGLSAVMSIKDENELRAIRDASRASAGLMAKFFVDQMSSIIDEEKKISHKKLSQQVSDKIDDEKFFQKLKVSDPSLLDWAIQPVVQSGGNYDLKLSAAPDDNNLHAGVILSTLGLRLQTYNSLVARTYLVDPNKSQENTYKLLLGVHDVVIKNARDGITAKELYKKAIDHIKSKKPDLEKNFVKSVGYGIGIEIRDATLAINGKNTTTLKDGMTLSITTGFNDVSNPNPQDNKSKTYAMILTDTVRVGPREAVVFTKDAPTDLESTSFFFNDEVEEKKEKPKAKKDSKVGAVAQTNIKSTRLRNERSTNVNEEKEAQRKEHQRELHQKKQREGLEKYGEGTGNLNGTEEKKFKKFESYKQPNQLPGRIKDLAITVESKSNSVIVPIMGRPVPFHINTIKNVSQTQEPGGVIFLRINFLSPGQGVGRKDDQPFEDATAHFIRSMTFRSTNAERMDSIVSQITEMKKSAVRREQEKKEMEDVVEQDKLVEIRNRRPHRLDNIFMRPALENKRIGGNVEVHQNGIRYTHLGGIKHDILFSNIKHLFFQDSKHELIVIIHMHLHTPIIIGKRKTKDVQFYREATEMQFDETGNRKRRHRYGDEEEFEAEQEERRRRAALDKEFKAFAERIAEAGRSENLQVDIPFRELSFNGVPARSSVTMSPTTDCLVQLTEPPFSVITLSEIEIVHLERVQFGLKNFDMVVLFKDYNRPPSHINTIPVDALDQLKDWLDSVDIPFTEGPLNLNWGQIMKTVTADPHQFYADGGWSFLAEESDDEGDDEESEESAFEVTDEDLASEESSEDDSEFDEEASAEASEDDMSGEDEEGEDWDELEKKAKKKDRESGLDDEEEKGRKKKR
ncbi:FACT complex subunit spt16 [Sphaceloma murrayae]|uniref:FACT complex subunit n=1 Tax=Sphaceloma murrayae TaxID=2082308 RepID=A0A2K1QXH7_9PEZI|nr:FACT complex subunit spt16 [Sphaceloma murrayae]